MPGFMSTTMRGLVLGALFMLLVVLFRGLPRLQKVSGVLDHSSS